MLRKLFADPETLRQAEKEGDHILNKKKGSGKMAQPAAGASVKSSPSKQPDVRVSPARTPSKTDMKDDDEPKGLFGTILRDPESIRQKELEVEKATAATFVNPLARAASSPAKSPQALSGDGKLELDVPKICKLMLKASDDEVEIYGNTIPTWSTSETVLQQLLKMGMKQPTEGGAEEASGSETPNLRDTNKRSDSMSKFPERTTNTIVAASSSSRKKTISAADSSLLHLLSLLASYKPWSHNVLQRVWELALQMQTEFASNSLVEALEPSIRLSKACASLTNFVKKNDETTSFLIPDESTRTIVLKSGLAVIKPFHAKELLLTRKGQAVLQNDPFNPAFLPNAECLDRLLHGFNAITTKAFTNSAGIEYLICFAIGDAIEFYVSQFNLTQRAGAMVLRALEFQSLIAFCTDSMSNADLMYVTEFGKDQLKLLRFSTTAVKREFLPLQKPMWQEENAAFLSLRTVGHVEFARQLSAVFQKLYMDLRPYHLQTQKTWEAEGFSNPGAALFLLMQGLSKWVGLKILSDVTLLGDCIRLGSKLMELNNYTGAFAVALGVSQHPVSRLQLPLEAADAKAFAALEELVNPQRNYANYNAIVAAVGATEPLVPHLGVALQQTTLLLDGTRSGGGYINKETIHNVWNVLKTFLSHKARNLYPFVDVPRLQKWILEECMLARTKDDDKMYELSYLIKPKAN